MHLRYLSSIDVWKVNMRSIIDANPLKALIPCPLLDSSLRFYLTFASRWLRVLEANSKRRCGKSELKDQEKKIGSPFVTKVAQIWWQKAEE